MKKLLSIIFSLMMFLALAAPAFAANDIEITGETFNMYYGDETQSIDETPDIIGEAPFAGEELSADYAPVSNLIACEKGRYVYDQAKLLSSTQADNLNKYLKALENKNKCSVYVVTMNEVYSDIESYTDDYYDYGGYGYGDDHTGIMMLLDMSDREWHITTTGSIIEALQPYIDNLADAFVDGLHGDDDFFTGFICFAEAVDKRLNADQPSTDDEKIDDTWEELGIDEWIAESKKATEMNSIAFGLSLPAFIGVSIAAGFVIAWIVVKSMKAKNNSVKRSSNANYYHKNGTFVVTRQNERFLYHTLTRTEKPKSNSSGSGGIHTGSSGTSHGGGSGHF